MPLRRLFAFQALGVLQAFGVEGRRVFVPWILKLGFRV